MSIGSPMLGYMETHTLSHSQQVHSMAFLSAYLVPNNGHGFRKLGPCLLKLPLFV